MSCVCGKSPAQQVFRVGPTGRKNFSFLTQVCCCGRLYPLPGQAVVDVEQKWVNRWNHRIELNEHRECEDFE